jgi:hypothetical protein
MEGGMIWRNIPVRAAALWPRYFDRYMAHGETGAGEIG